MPLEFIYDTQHIRGPTQLVKDKMPWTKLNLPLRLVQTRCSGSTRIGAANGSYRIMVFADQRRPPTDSKWCADANMALWLLLH